MHVNAFFYISPAKPMPFKYSQKSSQPFQNDYQYLTTNQTPLIDFSHYSQTSQKQMG